MTDLPANWLWNESREGMAVLNREGFVEQANPALCEFLGYSESELVGMHFEKVTSGQDVQSDLVEFAKVVDGERDSYSMHKLYRTKLSRLRPGSLRVKRIPGERLLIFGQVLPVDPFEAAHVPPDQRAEVVSLAVADLLRAAAKNWKVVLAVLAVLFGMNADKLSALIETFR